MHQKYYLSFLMSSYSQFTFMGVYMDSYIQELSNDYFLSQFWVLSIMLQSFSHYPFPPFVHLSINCNFGYAHASLTPMPLGFWQDINWVYSWKCFEQLVQFSSSSMLHASSYILLNFWLNSSFSTECYMISFSCPVHFSVPRL